MGARLVSKVFAFGLNRPLTGNEFRLLTFMAHTARDTDDPPRYFGSREMSAAGLGYDIPPKGTSAEGDLARKSAFEVVRRATARLVELGAIERTRRGRAGQRAEFTILANFTLDSLNRRPDETLGLLDGQDQ